VFAAGSIFDHCIKLIDILKELKRKRREKKDQFYNKGTDGSLMIPPLVRDIFGVSLDEKCGQRLNE
jgi:hypothetical protein